MRTESVPMMGMPEVSSPLRVPWVSPVSNDAVRVWKWHTKPRSPSPSHPPGSCCRRPGSARPPCGQRSRSPGPPGSEHQEVRKDKGPYRFSLRCSTRVSPVPCLCGMTSSAWITTEWGPVLMGQPYQTRLLLAIDVDSEFEDPLSAPRAKDADP